jgi:hypothetical protein
MLQKRVRPLRVMSDALRRRRSSHDVRYASDTDRIAPLAVIRRFGPQPDSCTAAKKFASALAARTATIKPNEIGKYAFWDPPGQDAQAGVAARC